MPAQATTTKTTIALTWTDAPLVRITAKRDFPEYGVAKGEVVYLARCSANDGTYYVVRFVASSWSCPCEGNAVYRRTCKHIKAASKHSKQVAERTVSRQLVALALAIPGGTTKPDRVPVPIARPSRDRAEAPLQRQGFSLLRTPGRGKQTQQASAFARHFEE
jgi:hypothetical protein